MADDSNSCSQDAFGGGAFKRDEPDRTLDDDVLGPTLKRMKLGEIESESSQPTSESPQPISESPQPISESPQPTSTCVLSFYGLPKDITEVEVAALAELHGTVTNIILTRNKEKALVQMAELSAAEAMMDHYSKKPLFVRSCCITVQHSNHSELRVRVGDKNVPMDLSLRVLHIIIDNMTFPVSIELLHQIFSEYGRVLKIVTFNLSESFHALIEYEDGASARNGKMSLNGQNIFKGCCRLFIEYSRLQNLVVEYNSDISMDYTKPDLTWNDSPSFATVTLQDKPAFIPGGSASLAAAPKRALLPDPGTGYPDDYVPFTLNLPRHDVPSMFLPATKGAKQYTNPYYASAGLPSAAAVPAPEPNPKKVIAWADRRPVVLVSNLDEVKATPDAIFTLFGVFGDVIRVKICCNKRSKALVMYKDYKYARDAVTNLDGVALWGRQLKLAISKYRIVQMPKEGAHNADLTKDYQTSRWHRFHNGDRATAPVVPPSKTLFLSNIPPKVTETKLKKLFNPFGKVVDFKFFEPSNLFLLQQAVQMAQLPPGSSRAKERILKSTPDKRMALIEMSSVEEAVESLVELHNKQFAGTDRFLCVSFTKSIIEHHGNGQ